MEGHWPGLLGILRAACLFPTCCPAQVRPHSCTSGQRRMTSLTCMLGPPSPVSNLTWLPMAWDRVSPILSVHRGGPVHCRLSHGIPGHYPLDPCSWGGGSHNPSVRTKYIPRLANVPSG